MNYELLSNLYKEEAEKNKNDALILKTRNEILQNEIENLRQKVKKIEEDFENSSANFLNIHTGEDYSKLLYQYFQKR